MSRPLPDWARYVPETRGRWRRRWLDLVLRATVRRKLDPDADMGAMRALAERMDARYGVLDPGTRRTPVAASGVPAEWVEVPESRADRVILYLHGGAFCLRFPRTHAALAARLCRRLGARALLPDYRLAPEHRYPAGLDDCVSAYRHLLAQGVEAKRIVVAGDSAGATFALATLHRLKDAALPLPACAVAISPVADFTLSGRSILDNERRDAMFTLRALVGMRALYADAERFLDPGVSPLYADFAGWPPLMLQVGSGEVLRDEATRVADKARRSGTDVLLEVYEHMPHVFHVMRMLPAGEDALDAIAGFVRARAGWTA